MPLPELPMSPEHQRSVVVGDKTQTFRFDRPQLGQHLMLHPASGFSAGIVEIVAVSDEPVYWTKLDQEQQRQDADREGHGNIHSFESACRRLHLHAFIDGRKPAYRCALVYVAPAALSEPAVRLAKVGIAALVDEATGYQQDRPADALAELNRTYYNEATKEITVSNETAPVKSGLTAFGLADVPLQPHKLRLHPRVHARQVGSGEDAEMEYTQVCDVSLRIICDPATLRGTRFYGALVAEVDNIKQTKLADAPVNVETRAIKSITTDEETRAHGIKFDGEEVVPRHGIALKSATILSVNPPQFELAITAKGLPAEVGGWDFMVEPPEVEFFQLSLSQVKQVDAAPAKGKPGRKKKKDKTAAIDFGSEDSQDGDEEQEQEQGE